jgi:predicted DNA binding CopG/RHH family protein
MSSTKRDFDYPTGVHGRIPSFDSVEEEAEFWDTHDFTDYLDEGRPVKIALDGELAERLTLRLESSDREALTRIARDKGIGPSTLVRMWIKERLRQEIAAQPD